MKTITAPGFLLSATLALLAAPALKATETGGTRFSPSALLLPVEDGVRQVRLSARDDATGQWSVIGVAHLDGEAGYLKMRIPEGTDPADLQVEVSQHDPFPAELYEGKTQFVEKTDQPPSYAYFRGDAVFAAAEDGGAGGEEGAPQPAEVVESDIWKWDGTTLYFFNQMRGLQVFDLSDPANPQRSGQLRMPAAGEQLYVLDDGTVVLLVNRWYGSGSEVVVVRHSGSALDPIARLPVAGGLVESRMIGSFLYVVSQRVEEQQTTNDDGNVIYSWRSGLEVASIDLSDTSAPRLHDSLYLTADGYNFYQGAVQATPEALFIATSHYDGTGVHSQVHYINLTDPQAPLAVQSVIPVAGYIKDKFKLHFAGGILTAVSETDTWTQRHTLIETFNLGAQQGGTGSPPPRLDSLALATGETLFATRFYGDRLYVVTFLQIDPLFAVDLSNPADLRLLGELEIPGWSTYLEPLGDTLLSVGVEGSRVAVSLFDVADPSNMGLSERIYLGGDYSWSEANYDEKAVGLLRNAGLLLVPFESYENGAYSSKIQIIEIEDDGLVQRGVLDHAFQARRATLVGDALVSVSGTELLVFDGSNLDDPALLSQLTIAWPVDRVFVRNPYLIQLENGNPWSGGSATLRVSTTAEPDVVLTELDLGKLPISGAALRDGRLVISHYEQLEIPGADDSEVSLEGRIHTRIFDLSDPLAPVETGSVAAETEELWWNPELQAAWLPDGALLWIAKTSHWFGWRGMEPGIGLVADVAFWPWSYNQTTEVHALDVSSDQPRVLSVTVLQPSSTDDYFVQPGEVVVHEDALYLSRQRTWSPKDEPEVYLTEALLDIVDFSDPEHPQFLRDIGVPGQLEHVHRTEDGGLLLFTTAARAPEQLPGQNQIWWYANDLEFQVSVFDGSQAFLVDQLRVPDAAYRPRSFASHRVALTRSAQNGEPAGIRFWEWQDKGALVELDSASLDIEHFRLDVAGAFLFASAYQGAVDAFDFLAPQPAGTAVRTLTAAPSYMAYDAAIALDDTFAWLPTGHYGVETVALPGSGAAEESPLILALREKSVEWRSLPIHSGLIVGADAEDFVGALAPGQLWRFQPGRQVLSLDQWMTLHFGDESDPEADPDADGLANLVEFGFGTDPRSALSKTHPVLRLNEDPGSGHAVCEVSFVRNPFAQGIYYELESSSDLENWEPVPGARIGSAEAPATPLFRFDLGEHGAAPQGFLRVSIGVEP